MLFIIQKKCTCGKFKKHSSKYFGELKSQLSHKSEIITLNIPITERERQTQRDYIVNIFHICIIWMHYIQRFM